MKQIILLIILFAVFSCSFTKDKQSINPDRSQKLSKKYTTTFVKVTSFLKHTEKELAKNKKVVAKLRETIDSDCFKSEFSKLPLIKTNKKNNQDIIKESRTEYRSVRLRMYYKFLSRVQGYTYPSSDIINLNRKYHSKFGLCDSAANLGHEVMHKFGYTHSYRPTKERPKSVPYSFGRVIDKCCVEN